MKKKNILIVGAGLIGSRRAQLAQGFSSTGKIFIFDLNKKRAKDLAKEVNGEVISDLDIALKDKSIDIVVVAVVNKFAKDICIKAIKNKKHVLCEKPMGINAKEAKAIFSAAEKNKVKVKCGFNHRFHSAILEAKKQVDKNAIGKVFFIRGVYGHGGRKGYDKEWRASKKLCGGGQLLDQGSHLIDLSLWFLNFEKIKKYNSVCKTMFWDMEVDDNAFVLLESNTGKVVQLHASWTQWKNRFKFEIYGEKGSIEVDGLGRSYGAETLRISKRKKLGKAPIVTQKVYKVDDSWSLEWKNFIQSINSRNKNSFPMSNHKESLEVMKVITNLYKK